MLTHIQMEEKYNRSKERSVSKEEERSVFPSANQGHSFLTDDRQQSETAYYNHAKPQGHSAHYYQDRSAGEKKEPVQRRKSDFYKGGAELECNSKEAELQFEGSNSWDPDLLYEGIKGVSLDHSDPDLNVLPDSVMVKGNNWNLTVELMGFDAQKIKDMRKTSITLELIIGGPTGTKLSELPRVAEEAAEQIAKLDSAQGKKLTFRFDEQVFQTVADNVIGHQASHAERKMKVIETKYPSLYSSLGLPISDLSQLIQKIDEICGPKDPANISIKHLQKKEDGVEVPGVPPPLSEHALLPPPAPAPPPPPTPAAPFPTRVPTHSASSKSKIVSEGTDSRHDQKEVCIILEQIREDLEKKKKAEELKETSQFSMLSEVKIPIGGLSAVDWGLQVTLGIPINEIPGMITNLLNVTKAPIFSKEEYWSTISGEELESQLEHKCQSVQESELLRHMKEMADWDSYLGGLAEIISAYRRGINNNLNDGPKHTMRLVNKNPLDQVIMKMEGLSEDGKKFILHTCVDMIVNGNDCAQWNWVGATLSVKEWSAKMKADPPVDLVSVYDGAYRHGQIGQLSSLNENEEGARQVPVFEFRNLSSIKISELADLFRTVAAYCDKADPAEPRTTE